MLDYTKWRGDLPYRQIPFNLVDALLCSRIVYLPLDLVLITKKTSMTLGEAASEIVQMKDYKKKLLIKDDDELLHLAIHNPRLSDIVLSGFINEKNPEDQMQFCAMTMEIPDTGKAIVYRGTDSTLLGWKEDFNMSFQNSVPGQHRAVKYLEDNIQPEDERIYMIGHSKGGNFAVFASAFCAPDIQKKIRQIYNFDGPGFQQEIINTPGYQAVVGRIHTYVPQSSIVGMLLEHEETYTVIKSDSKVNFMQHDTYSWLTDRDGFHILRSITIPSQIIDHTLKDWVAHMSVEQREQVIDSLYEAISKTNARTIRDLRHNPVGNIRKILSSLQGLDDPTRHMIWNALGKLNKALFLSIKEEESPFHSSPNSSKPSSSEVQELS